MGGESSGVGVESSGASSDGATGPGSAARGGEGVEPWQANASFLEAAGLAERSALDAAFAPHGGGARLPFQRELEAAFGEDFSDVEVRLGVSGGSGQGARVTFEGGRDVLSFDSPSPNREQVAHELAHVSQRRRFGAGGAGSSRAADGAEVEAREVAARAASGAPVQVASAPSANVMLDDDVAARIHDKLHSWVDDEAGALSELRSDRDRRGTCTTYHARYGIQLWTDFIDNASGGLLRQALALLWPHMSLLQRLETHLGFDDDEQAILQTIQTSSDAEVRAARGGIQRYLDELDPPDQFTARQRVWPERPIENVLWLLEHGNGIFDDEGPAATAVMRLTPAQRAQLWREHPDAFAMFSDHDREQLRRMCVNERGEATTDAAAARVRMELATDGPGTDEDGVRAALGSATSRRDEQARIREALRTGRDEHGLPLTPARRAELERRRDEIGDVDSLLTATPGTGGALDEDSFLGRVQGDMDAGTLDTALADARVSAFIRAKQALLGTAGETGIDIDEDAVLRILRGIQGEVELAPGETLAALGADEVRSRRARSANEIRARLRRDPDLRHIWAALSTAETEYADSITRGDTYAMAIHELTRAFEGIDTDEAAILRVVRDMSPADRERMRRETPRIVTRIRDWGLGANFNTAFEHVLVHGTIPPNAALDHALGGWGDGTDEDLVTEVLAGMNAEERARMRRGYMLWHTRDRRPSDSALSAEDRAAMQAFAALRTRLEGELTDEEMDAAMATLVGMPSVAEMSSDQGRVEAATIMLLRQRERLEMHAGITDVFTTTDNTAAAANVEYEARYNEAMLDGTISAEGFAVLVQLDTQFNQRFLEYSETANLVSEIASTVAAVVAGAVVIILSGPAAPATAGGVAAWISANSTLLAGAATASALTQVVVAEATGGSFNEMTDADGARQALSGALNGALMVCGAALAERAASLVGLSGRALTAQIARSAASATEASVAGRAFARGALTGLIDGSLGGAVGELAMTLTDAETWRHSVWDVLARAGAAFLRGGLLGGSTGAVAGGLLESAQALLRARSLAHVRVELDSELAARSHIDFTVNPDGSLQNLTLRFGPATADGDLAAEVERVVVIERASRVLARARAITSRAGHAEQEAIKIEQMIQDRLRQLRGPLSPQSRELVDSELDVLQANLDEFERVAASGDPALGSGRIGRPDAPPGYPEPPAGHYYRRRGDGWDLQLYPDTPEGTPRFTLEPDGSGGWRTVSRDAVAGAPAARFPEGTSAAQAFEQLTGPDSRSSFKQYWEMLRDNHLATREEVIAAMLSPGGRSEDSVRHALKESFRTRVIDHTLRDLDGRVLTEAESMVRLRGLTEHLNSSDRGNLTEAWYARRHDGLVPHPEMTRDANPGVVGREGRGVRTPDFLEGETLVELKSTSRGLGPEEVAQINDDLRVCRTGGTVSVEGVAHSVSGLRLVFSNIEGARGAAAQLDEWLRLASFFTVEVYGSSGASTRISAATLPALQRRAGVSSLAELLAVL